MQEFIIQLARDAGAIAADFFLSELQITTKTDRNDTQQYKDIVTQADVAVNAFIIERIQAGYADHAITSEESDDVLGTGTYEWIIDPIDGTFNFAHQVPMWAVMISVLKDSKPLYSVVYFPMVDQLFFANETDSFCNNKKLAIMSSATLQNGVGKVFTMRPHGPYGVDFERFQTALVRYFSQYECHVRDFGSAASLVYLLHGAFDFAISNGGLVWDFWAPIHIVRNAGAIVTDSRGNEWQRGQQEYVAAANPIIHAELLALFDSYDI
jgi:myo-inositol-1(or 4)-monophosphatase